MQPVLSRAGGGFREARPAAALDRERVGTRARSNAPSRRSDALDAADNLLLFRTATRQICRRMGYLATFMARPGAQGLLCERLAPAPVAGRCQEPAEPVHAASATASRSRRSAAAISPGCCSMRGRHRVRDADRQRLSPLPAELARARPRHLGHDHRGVMVRVLGGAGRSGDADREPDRRARRQPLSLHRRRRSWPVSTASTHKLDPGPQDDEPYAADRPMLPKSLPDGARPRWRGAAVPRAIRRGVRRLFPQAQAQRGRPLRDMAARCAACAARATSRPSGSRMSISIFSSCCGRIVTLRARIRRIHRLRGTDRRASRHGKGTETPCWKKSPRAEQAGRRRRLYD